MGDQTWSWIWGRSISSMLKAFDSSTPASRRASQSFTVQLTSGNGCCENEEADVQYRKIDKENKMKPTQTKPSIVFCHGIWADGSCFNKLIPTLQVEGHQVIAVQYGLDSHAADFAATKRTLGRVSSPAILAGHSYGGGVITPASNRHCRFGLGYIAP